MKEPMTQTSAKGERFRIPAPEGELAFERTARRARARAVALLQAALARQLKSKDLTRRGDTVPRYEMFLTTRNTMTTSFWQSALASLPPSVQRRHAASFEAAERFEALLDLGFEAWGSAKDVLARICQAAARAMRGTARVLESAAHRL